MYLKRNSHMMSFGFLIIKIFLQNFTNATASKKSPIDGSSVQYASNHTKNNEI